MFEDFYNATLEQSSNNTVSVIHAILRRKRSCVENITLNRVVTRGFHFIEQIHNTANAIIKSQSAFVSKRNPLQPAKLTQE